MRFVQAPFIAIAIFGVLQFPVRTIAQEPLSGQSARPLTNQDVLQMVQAKFDDTTIVKMIQAHDTNFDLSVGAMMSLKNAGVSQTVMQAMLSPATSASPPAHSSVTSQPAANVNRTLTTPSWLHPSYAEYQQAIEEGYQSKLQKKFVPRAKYLYLVVNKTQPALFAGIELHPPLFCALSLGQIAASELKDRPLPQEVMIYCDGRIHTYFTYFTTTLNDAWPLTLTHDGTTIQSEEVSHGSPDVTTYYGGFIQGDTVGYRYLDNASFIIPDAWQDALTVTYVRRDEIGEPRHTSVLDLSGLVKDELAHRTPVSGPTQ